MYYKQIFFCNSSCMACLILLLGDFEVQQRRAQLVFRWATIGKRRVPLPYIICKSLIYNCAWLHKKRKIIKKNHSIYLCVV